MANDNLSISLGYKGSGAAQAIPVYQEGGIYTEGGSQSQTDTQTAYFGYVASVDPNATSPGQFFCGIPSGYIPVGVIMYSAGVAMVDAAKPDFFIQDQPMAICELGQLWFSTWTKVSPNAIDPVVGCVVICNNTTGVIEFQPMGATAPTGWTVINAQVKSINLTTNGAMLFVNF
jgi:hypothetical protein